MSKQIDIIYLTEEKGHQSWSLGSIYTTKPSVPEVKKTLEEVSHSSSADYVLVWDPVLGGPDPEKVTRVADLPGNVWHAGLRLGTGGKPDLIDFVWPDWMFTRDPEPDKEATSWRISLRACLLKRDVLVAMGGIHGDFKALEGAALEMGHRYITRGVFTRHVPWMLPDTFQASTCPVPLEDEFRFIYYRAGAFWSWWALLRVFFTGAKPRIQSGRILLNLTKTTKPLRAPGPYLHTNAATQGLPEGQKVSVLIPTIGRYNYLLTLLSQIRELSIHLEDVVVVDQTPLEKRDAAFYNKFSDLPLKVIYQDKPGQCGSRNAGINQCNGQYILLIDDDDEIPPGLIKEHLETIHQHRAQVSAGVCRETGAGNLPNHFKYVRASDVFPANNCLIEKKILKDSGLFDLAYDHGSRADGDLGMRLYLQGNHMILNPDISVIHHHAPSGGLRTHRARRVTYASSRQNLLHRHLPSVTEIYLAMRYFTPRQVEEMLWQRALGTFQIRGNAVKKLMKAVISSMLTANTAWVIYKRRRLAAKMFEKYPEIHAFV